MKVTFCIIALVLATLPLNAKQSHLDRFTGYWEGDGALFGAKAEFEMKWNWVLDRKFLHLEFKSERISENGSTISFSGHGYYNFKGDSLTGTWFDSRGISFPLKGNFDDHSIITEWGSEDLEKGKTEYILHRNGSMQAVDYVFRDGEYAQFSHAILYPTLQDDLAGFTLSGTNMPEMVDFYSNVFDIRFEELVIKDYTLYEGEWMGLSILICPAELAQNQAEQTRHQLDIRVANFDSVLEKITKFGGEILGEILVKDGVREVGFYDPDRNSMVLKESKAQKKE